MNQYYEKVQAYLKVIDDTIAKGPYKDNWKSLMNHKVPDWYRNAKFGIFIHWGAYSVPAWGNEWYPRFMYKDIQGDDHTNFFTHHIETYGSHKQFGYKDFIPMFRAEKFDAAQWADLFQEAGARFVMPVAEHHDGFQMYDSELSEWCASKKGPKKDTLGLLKKEIERRGMVLTASSHRVEHYWFMCGGKEFDSGMPENPEYADLYWPSNKEPFENQAEVDVKGVDPAFMEDWLARTCEIVDKYRPKIMYFDWWIQVKPMKPYLKKFAAYYYNRAEQWGEEVTINYKNDAFMHTVAVKDIERGQLEGTSPYFWQNDTSVAKNSWCYTENNDYKKPRYVICDLIDVVSKNGSLLLNIGPKADGTIPEQDAHILKEVGKWLRVNGEGIYDTMCWRKCGEGPTVTKEGHFTDTIRSEYTTEDFRFTFKDGALYVFAMKWPEDGLVRIKTLGRTMGQFNSVVSNVEILGVDTPVRYVLCDDYLSVIADHVKTDMPVCIKITSD